jgi:TRAP-type uncharacterized transport system substrate-binding protein
MKKMLLSTAAMLVAALMSAPAMAAGAAPAFRLCTGNAALNYFKAGHYFKQASTSVPIEVIESKGSLDNLDKVTAGECDGAFVQADSLLVYSAKNAKAISSLERAGVLYQEHAHLLCNRNASIGRIVDLTKSHTIAVGPEGSGSRTTWDAFVMADKKRYAPVNIDVRSGVRALSAVADGSQVQCALVITALNSSFIKGDAQQLGDRIVLAGTDDRDMKGVAKDPRGQPVYSYGEIPANTYPRVQPSGVVYGTKSVDTIAVDAIFVANQDWINANERSYESLLRAFSAAKPNILNLVQPK